MSSIFCIHARLITYLFIYVKDKQWGKLHVTSFNGRLMSGKLKNSRLLLTLVLGQLSVSKSTKWPWYESSGNNIWSSSGIYEIHLLTEMWIFEWQGIINLLRLKNCIDRYFFLSWDDRFNELCIIWIHNKNPLEYQLSIQLSVQQLVCVVYQTLNDLYNVIIGVSLMNQCRSIQSSSQDYS